MSKCHYTMGHIPSGRAILPGWTFPKITADSLIIFPDIVPLDHDWCTHMINTYALRPWYTVLFYRPARFYDNVAHVDMVPWDRTQILDAIVINWVWGGRGSDMVWYELPSTPSEVTRWERSTGEVIYQGWPVEDLVEQDRVCIGRTPTLTRVDVPHSVDMADQARWGLSIRFHPQGHRSWDELVEDFHQRGWLDVDIDN